MTTGEIIEGKRQVKKFTRFDFAKPETEIEKWILGDVIESLNVMREQYEAHMATGETVEAERYSRGIDRMLNLRKE